MVRARLLCLLALVVVPAGLAVPAAAQAKVRAPYLLGVRCVPATAAGCKGMTRAKIGAQVQLRGNRLYKGMRVSFRWTTGALASTLQHKASGWIARIPAGTKLGQVAVTVRDQGGRRSNARHILVKPIVTVPKPKAVTLGALPDAFKGNGMWIWELDKSEKGNLTQIAIKARAAGMQTVFVKSGDGADQWDQFNPTLVQTLHAQGLKVCAWQFVYGKHPSEEATVAAASIADGADCYVIDAESDYEGRYAQAQTFMNQLRAAVGESYPIGLTSFPYITYHPTLPYSVFFGQGGAQANLPQVYWKTIGNSVQAASARTFIDNRIYGAAIAPLGQAYNDPVDTDLTAFRQIWESYGSEGISWWSWQSSSAATWSTLAQPDPLPAEVADPGWPLLTSRSKGDEVIWLQEHLASVYSTVAVNGTFGSATQLALQAYQTAQGLPPTGQTDEATWKAVLALPLRTVDWSGGGKTAVLGGTAPGVTPTASSTTTTPTTTAPTTTTPSTGGAATTPTSTTTTTALVGGGAQARAAGSRNEIPELGKGG